MIPTENEYTLATHAAAQKLYAVNVERRRAVFPPSAQFADWDDLPRDDKRFWLEEVLPIVDAAISAIPDRLDRVRAALKLVEDDDITPMGRRILEQVIGG